MDFRMEADLPFAPNRLWPIMLDIREMAGCIPGIESIEEKERLKAYSALMKQKIGPFKLEVPAEIVVEDFRELEFVIAQATGKDKFTGTTLRVNFNLRLEALEAELTRLAVQADLQIAGRLASLGHSMIKKKAQENFAEFEANFRKRLDEI